DQNKLSSFPTRRSSDLEEDAIKDYDMMVSSVTQYKEDGNVLNEIISDLSATAEELTATLDNVSISINEISTTIEESTKATTNIRSEEHTSELQSRFDLV